MSKRLLPFWSCLVLLASACGDDGGTPPPGDDDTTPCGGHGQPECTGEFVNHNAGEIRLEYILTNTGSYQVILYAWFISAQDPEKIPYATDGQCLNSLSYTNTTNPGAAVNASRVYEDVGDTVTLTYKDQTIVLNRYTNIADKRGLIMGIGYAHDGAARGTVPPEAILPGAEYTIHIGGELFPYKLKVPTPWQTSGGNMTFAVGATTNLKQAADISWQYQFVNEPYTQSGLLSFTGNNAGGMKETWLCIGPATGRIDIPATTMATFPAAGNVQGATVAHQKVEYKGRLLDVIGVTCRQTPYVIQ